MHKHSISSSHKENLEMAPTTTRWCPTPEQLMVLEEMYRSGVRTPSATQIQHITAHLSHYGKIEGKNVFYWFQNHKARDRQKLRRRLTKHLLLHQQQHHHHRQLLPATPTCGFPVSLPHHQVYNTWRPEIGFSAAGKMEDDDWVVVSPNSNTRPLETLELFPVTPSGSKGSSLLLES